MNYLKNYYSTTSSNNIREWVESYMNTIKCPTCRGGRLKKESLSVTFQNKNISEVTSLSIFRSHEFFNKVKLSGREQIIAKPILKVSGSWKFSSLYFTSVEKFLTFIPKSRLLKPV